MITSERLLAAFVTVAALGACRCAEVPRSHNKSELGGPQIRPPLVASLAELEQYFEKRRSALREARQREVDRLSFDESAVEGDEALGRLGRELHKLQTYAYPETHVDWTAVDRARAHRDRMPDMLRSHLTDENSEWEFIGPRNFSLNGTVVSGRVNAIAIDPADPRTIYAGSAGGGVWKSTDSGGTWTPLSNAWPYEEVSSLAVDPTSPSTLYVGTGDFHAWSDRSFGLMKSTDGGLSFAQLAVPETGKCSISSIVVFPEAPSVVLLTSGRGRVSYGKVWRSTDGGATWAAPIAVQAEWSQVALGVRDGAGSRAAYAVGWNLSGGLMYRSFDQGLSWTALNVPWGPDQYGISVATSPLDPLRVYVLAGNDRKIFRSVDGGTSWTDATGDLRRDDFEWNQVDYDWCFACTSSGGASPSDVLFVGLKHLYRSESNGVSWITTPHGHDDMHCIVPDPRDPRRVYLGNDGGVFSLAWSYKAGGWKVWSIVSLNAGLGITECYGGSASPLDKRIVLGATQDNAVASSQNDLNNWKSVFPPVGGDAITAAVSPTSTQIQFVEGGVAFYGIARTMNQWVSKTDITPPAAVADIRNPFAMPITMDTFGSRLFWGTDYLWIWDEASSTWAPRVGGQRLATSGSKPGINALGVFRGTSDIVYTGSTDGQLWLGRGPSWSWTRIDTGLPLPSRRITGISVHPTNPYDVFVGLGGTGIEHLWRCRDTSVPAPAWEAVSGTGSSALPDVPVIAVVRDPSAPSNALYVGTDIGVFATDDAGMHWSDLTIPHGLPAAELGDLQIVGRYLYAFTFGRGVWRRRLPFTDCAPVAASIGGTTFFVAKGIDGQLFISQMRFGQAASEWLAIQGNGLTDASPAVAVLDKTLFVFAKGLDGRIYVNQTELRPDTVAPEAFAKSFSGWFEVQGDGRTDAAPAATSVENTVFVFVKGIDGRIYGNQAEFGQPFVGWQEAAGDGITDTAPAATTVGKSLFVFVKGLDGRIYVNQAEFGQAGSGWFEVQGDGITDSAPAATSVSGTVFVFVKGLDNRIYGNQAVFGQPFVGWNEAAGDGRTDAAPGAGCMLNNLFVLVRGLDGAGYFNQAEFGHPGSGWIRMDDELP